MMYVFGIITDSLVTFRLGISPCLILKCGNNQSNLALRYHHGVINKRLRVTVVYLWECDFKLTEGSMCTSDDQVVPEEVCPQISHFREVNQESEK